ncbi:hypothetical protein CAPTEDRAFT_127508, partial [Capitella teleta]
AMRDFLVGEEIPVMESPSHSPDVSPIDHIWDELERRVVIRRPGNFYQSRELLVEERAAIPLHTICRLIDSIIKRCSACI